MCLENAHRTLRPLVCPICTAPMRSGGAGAGRPWERSYRVFRAASSSRVRNRLLRRSRRVRICTVVVILPWLPRRRWKYLSVLTLAVWTTYVLSIVSKRHQTGQPAVFAAAAARAAMLSKPLDVARGGVANSPLALLTPSMLRVTLTAPGVFAGGRAPFDATRHRDDACTDDATARAELLEANRTRRRCAVRRRRRDCDMLSERADGGGRASVTQAYAAAWLVTSGVAERV